MWTVNYLNEKERRPVVIKTYPRGYPQCQSDKSIDRPSMCCTRLGGGIYLIRADLLSKKTTEVGTKKTWSAVCRSTTLTSQILLGRERDPVLRGVSKGDEDLWGFSFFLLRTLAMEVEGAAAPKEHRERNCDDL
ncbi:hypothetical protein TNCV_488401 [Trichonephila clavipes]|nr:hypothetical protein TNCV_488401 [Trichonephila clavipes]